jgi:hypothetical protein
VTTTTMTKDDEAVLKYCPTCRARHAAERLYQHCKDKHGMVPLLISQTKPGDYAAAAAILRKAKFTITSLREAE